MKGKLHRFTTEAPSTDAENAEYYVLGGQRVGASVAEELHAQGRDVYLIDDYLAESSIPGQQADPRDVRALDAADLSSDSTVLVATACDSQNLLLAQLVRTRFDAQRVVVRANSPDRIDLFPDAGHEPVCATTALTDALVDTI